MKNKWNKRQGWLAGLSLCLSMVACTKSDQIIIDVAQEGAEVPSSLYGVFFEEITHSGDGGLYAEMVVNRGFEDGNLPSGTTYKDGYAVAKSLPCYSNDSINNFKVKWQDDKAMNGWQVVCAAGQPVYKIVDNQPLHPATPHALQLELGKSAGDVQVINNGYWNMALTEGSSYKLAFHLKADAASNEEVTVSLIDENEQPAASQSFKITKDNQWHKYEGALVSASTGNKYRLALTFKNKGNVYLDYVSLFPEETFMNRPNGMRKDVAETLADLHPAFIRWPGGCIVEGLTMENRIKWKETIGDPVTRPGEYNLWGYPEYVWFWIP